MLTINTNTLKKRGFTYCFYLRHIEILILYVQLKRKCKGITHSGPLHEWVTSGREKNLKTYIDLSASEGYDHQTSQI
eukprot:UN22622